MPAIPPRIEFHRASDGQDLAARVWRVAAPTARVIFLHGITSHGGWYHQVAEFLSAAGVEVHLLDRRGSGLNGQQAGDVDDWHTWVDDVAGYIRARDKEKSQSPDGTQPARRTPTILGGISWGGKLAAAVARRYPALLDGVAFICPGLYSPYSPGIAKRLVLAAPVPARLQQRRLKVPLRRAELFTDSRNWQDFIALDPLALRKITWRFAQADRQLTSYARQAAPFLYTRSLLMLAGQDRIVDNPRTRKFFGQLASPHKTLIEYSCAGHTLEFERDPTAYFADLLEWTLQTASAAATR